MVVGMSTAKLAEDFLVLLRAGKNLEAIDKYYSPNIVSVESMSAPGMPAEMKGIDAIRGKNQWWLDNHEIHSATINGPYTGDTKFAVELLYDVTNKPSGNRMQMEEMALYTVEGDKIVHEHFYYKTGQ